MGRGGEGRGKPGSVVTLSRMSARERCTISFKVPKHTPTSRKFTAHYSVWSLPRSAFTESWSGEGLAFTLPPALTCVSSGQLLACGPPSNDRYHALAHHPRPFAPHLLACLPIDKRRSRHRKHTSDLDLARTIAALVRRNWIRPYNISARPSGTLVLVY